MALASLLTDLDRKIILFSYENQKKKLQPISIDLINDDLRTFVVREGNYILWELNKRKFHKNEIISRSWMLNSEQNTSFIVNFKRFGILSVSNIFHQRKHCGSWKLENGLLKIRFDYHESSYDITVVASNSEPVHSALQERENNCTELLRTAPLRRSMEGKSLNF